MKLIRGLLLAVAAALVLIACAAALACNPRFQTWALRRVLARRPALGVSVDSVSIGLNDVTLRGVHVRTRGALLTIPVIEAEMPVLSDAFGDTLQIRHLAARGWQLDLRAYTGGGAAFVSSQLRRMTPNRPAAEGFSLLSTASAAGVATAQAATFLGVLNQLKLPVNFALDGLDLDGDAILPVGPGRAGGRMHVMLDGGGVSSGEEGRFAFNFTFVPAEKAYLVNSLLVNGTLEAAMDSPRTFKRLALRMDATATGPRLPRAVRLSAGLAAARGPAGETYSLTLDGEDRRLAAVQAAYPDAQRRVAGTWKLDLSDNDLNPFTLGRALPLFNGVGEGRFDADGIDGDVHVRGRLNFSADRLGSLRPQLAGVGAVRLVADFDLTRRGSELRVDRLNASLSGARPILSVHGLQDFAFNGETGELTVADPARDLFGVTLQDLPLAWMQPFLRHIIITGGSLRGSLVAGARNGGVSLHSTTPLTVANLSATREGQPLFGNFGFSLGASAEYSPLGWQLEFKSGAASCPIEGIIGRLAGPSEPVKFTGRIGVNLPAMLARTAMSVGSGPGQDSLSSGNLVCDFAGSLGEKRAIEAKLDVSDIELVHSGQSPGDGLTTSPTTEKLPDVGADVRAEIGADDRVVFEAPFRVSKDGRESDLTLKGTAEFSPVGVHVDGQVSGEKIFLNDVRILAVILSPGWNRASGRLTLGLKNVVASQFTATDVTGTLALEPKALRFDALHASLGDTGDATISGSFTFDPLAGDPYALTVAVNVGNFDPAPVFRVRYPGRTPTLEGKFNITGDISGRGATPWDAAIGSQGTLSFVSTGGVLHLLTMDGGSQGASARKVAILGYFIGNLTGAVTGRKELGQAVTQVVGKISEIPYDQMSFVLSRNASLDTEMEDFALISPEVRLEGGGHVTYEPGEPLLEQPLAAEFKLRARGNTAEVFKLVGMLGSKADDLGYFEFTEPIKIAGTLGKPDTSELQATLLNDIYNRSGASDLFDKLLGK